MAENGMNPKKGWDPQEAYKKVSSTINAWPGWKKRAYNEIFAVSAHAERIPVGGERGERGGKEWTNAL